MAFTQTDPRNKIQHSDSHFAQLTLPDIFFSQAEKYQTRSALQEKKNGRYVSISWNEFRNQVLLISGSLVALGVQKGSLIGILCENRPEWAWIDMAVLTTGAADVPIYATSAPKEIEYIVKHAEIKLLFVSTQEQLNKVLSISSACSALERIIVIDGTSEKHPKVWGWSEFLDQRHRLKNAEEKIKTRVESIQPDQLATVIYTSGTTGPPKGVMLSHRNFIVNCQDAEAAIPLGDKDNTLSFLPLSHVFERMAGLYFPICRGAMIAYAENMNTVQQNLVETKPTLACAVPRLYEKMHAKVIEEIGAKPRMVQKLANWCLAVGSATIPYRLARKRWPIGLWLEYALADLMIFRKIRQKLGGRLKFFISGGAPLPKELGEFFFAAGINILEGYGLTETSPVITVNRIDRLKFGTVGVPFDHAEVKIAEDGEILTKGPCVMMGYFKNEAATKEVIKDGWFYTGDIGLIDADGFLKITDRKKDIIVTSGGKNISPQNIENTVKLSSAIQQVIVFGDRRNYLVALVVPNFEYLTSKIACAGLSHIQMCQDARICEFIAGEIEKAMVDFANYEKIKYFKLLAEEFKLEKGEITPTLKVKRKVVMERYADLINSMYQNADAK